MDDHGTDLQVVISLAQKWLDHSTEGYGCAKCQAAIERLSANGAGVKP